MSTFETMKQANSDTKYVEDSSLHLHARAITYAVRGVAERHGITDDELVMHLQNLAAIIYEGANR